MPFELSSKEITLTLAGAMLGVFGSLIVSLVIGRYLLFYQTRDLAAVMMVSLRTGVACSTVGEVLRLVNQLAHEVGAHGLMLNVQGHTKAGYAILQGVRVIQEEIVRATNSIQRTGLSDDERRLWSDWLATQVAAFTDTVMRAPPNWSVVFFGFKSRSDKALVYSARSWEEYQTSPGPYSTTSR